MAEPGQKTQLQQKILHASSSVDGVDCTADFDADATAEALKEAELDRICPHPQDRAENLKRIG